MKAALLTVLLSSLAACSSDPGDAPGTEGATKELRSSVARATPPSGSEQRAIDDLSAFAWSFYGQAKKAGENFVYSPYSIAAATAMLSTGAAGQTLTEIAQALHFGGTGASLHEGQNALSFLLESRNRAKTESESAQSLRITNDFWMAPGLEPTSDFLDTLARDYDSGVHIAPFPTKPEECRVAINQKVSEDTGGLIPKLLPEGSIDSSVVFVLTNALYFKAAWATKFETSATRPAAFATPTATVEVPTMRGALSGEYAAGDGFIAVSLPYARGELEMVFVVPDAGTFASFVDSLTNDGVTQILSGLAPRYLDVSLPKFEVETALPLKEQLMLAGMEAAFSRAAEFPGIGHNIYISDAFHQAKLILDEEGTEAAAATAFVGQVTSILPTPTVVAIDRPFVFFLRDTSGAVLFVGHVVDPR